MTVRAVIGANFGDEGKGLITDYLCRTYYHDVVVRFNGGANAGHTVVDPAVGRHVFRHFGSGTFAGVPTFLSQYFIVNPLLAVKELATLRTATNRAMLPPLRVYAHPDCMVTTFVDMLVNQHREWSRGEHRHGTCGVGINETVRRHAAYPITMQDLWDGTVDWPRALKEISYGYYGSTYGCAVPLDPVMIEATERTARRVARLFEPARITQFSSPVFEGAQGLLLDRGQHEFFPHVTNSHTGLRNVRMLCEEAGFMAVEAWYVSRTYLTRHGPGPLPGEDPAMRFRDDTNVENKWQGALRFGWLNVDELHERIDQDAGEVSRRLVFTHCDQLQPPCEAYRYAYGATADDVFPRLLAEWERKRYGKVAVTFP